MLQISIIFENALRYEMEHNDFAIAALKSTKIKCFYFLKLVLEESKLQTEI